MFGLQYQPILSLPTGSTEITFQVTSFRAILENGSLLLIHGKTIALPVNRITKGPRHGSLKAICSLNGKNLDGIVFYGYTGSVSRPPGQTLLWRLIVFHFRSRRREEHNLVS